MYLYQLAHFVLQSIPPFLQRSVLLPFLLNSVPMRRCVRLELPIPPLENLLFFHRLAELLLKSVAIPTSLSEVSLPLLDTTVVLESGFGDLAALDRLVAFLMSGDEVGLESTDLEGRERRPKENEGRQIEEKVSF
jgi:hypothetical protein